MSISRIVIDGYRSIEHLDLTLGTLNALIGPNNAGKSNIVRALNLALGEVWPTRAFTERDRHGYAGNAIDIQVFFDGALSADPDVAGFRLTYSVAGEVEYVPIDVDGNACMYPGGREKRISSAMREEATLLHIGIDRQAEKQIRSNQWTVYGKLLRKISEEIDPGAKAQFVHDVEAAVDAHIRPALADTEDLIADFIRRQTDLDVELQFQNVDPLDVLKGVRPFVIDGMSFDPEDLGAGVQSALAVAIAKAYAKVVRQPIILAIDEPELFLHPHGCRHFYRLLTEVSGNGLQILYTTHERAFVSAANYEQVHLVRKRNSATTVFSGANIVMAGGAPDRLRLQSRFNDRVSESFFAKCVVLVEGDCDEVAVRSALEALGLELDKASVSVIAVGGKGEVGVLAELLRGFQIPTIAVLDEDPGDLTSATNIARVRGLLSPPNVFLQQPDLEGLLGLPQKPTKVQAMQDFPAMLTGGGIPQVYTRLLARVRVGSQNLGTLS